MPASQKQSESQKLQDLVAFTLDAMQQIQQLDKEQKVLGDEVKDAADRIKKLEDKVEERRMIAMVGQLAYEIDKEVLHNVLSDLIDVNEKHVYSIRHMEKAIEGKDRYDDILEHKEDRLKAEKKWNDLKYDLGWEDRHYRELQHLKELCGPYALPDFNPETLKQALKTGSLKVIDGCWDDILLERFLEMYQHLRGRNSQAQS